MGINRHQMVEQVNLTFCSALPFVQFLSHLRLPDAGKVNGCFLSPSVPAAESTSGLDGTLGM